MALALVTTMAAAVLFQPVLMGPPRDGAKKAAEDAAREADKDVAKVAETAVAKEA